MPLTTERSTCPAALTSAVRSAIQAGGPAPDVAARVAEALSRHLPAPGQLLTAAQLAGDPAGYQTHPVHVEADGSFSIAVMVWRAGQVTPIHDHVSWCVTGVLAGIEYEEIFTLSPDGGSLTAVTRRQNAPGTVAGFAPPGTGASLAPSPSPARPVGQPTSPWAIVLINRSDLPISVEQRLFR